MGVAPFSIALDLCIELGGVASSDNLLTPHLCYRGGSTTDMVAVTWRFALTSASRSPY